jgi:hypothetical protein
MERRDHMPTHQFVREQAQRRAARVTAFSQPADECSAWVAIWLRKQLAGKFLDQWFRDAARYTMKASMLYGSFSREKDARDMASRYIMYGGGKSKINARVIQEVIVFKTLNHRVISSHLAEDFELLSSSRLAYFSFLTSKGSHAVAACGTTTGFTFFDPNVGEFHFPSVAQCLSWFTEMLDRSRQDGKGPFNNIGSQYNAFIYTRPVLGPMPVAAGDDPFADVKVDMF